MGRTIVAVAIAIGPAGAAASQTPPAPPATGGSAPQMVRAAGMPLQDGTLPPGSLTVRVVQGAFSGDLTGIPIEVEVAGQPTLRGQTKALGRAEFAHLPIGAQVSASARVNGSRLQSESFRMPAESGVRVLLITGEETAGHGAGAAPPSSVSGDVPAPAAISAAAAETTGHPTNGVTIVQVTTVLLTLLAFAAVFVQQWRRARSRRAGPR